MCVVFGGEIMNRQQKIFVMLMAACMAFTGISTISMASAAKCSCRKKWFVSRKFSGWKISKSYFNTGKSVWVLNIK